MNIENVIQVCGPLSQPAPNTSNGNKKSNLGPLIGAVLIVVIGYLIYSEWKNMNHLDKK